jgi:predicted nucleic acid-binding protein
VIVVDTNIIAYLYLESEFTIRAEALLLGDPVWVVPMLWRSEFRNILAGAIRRDALGFEDACRIVVEAEGLLAGNEHDVASRPVLQLVRDSDCSAYDCEFAALAAQLGVRLVTMDRKLLNAFPELAQPLPAG